MIPEDSANLGTNAVQFVTIQELHSSPMRLSFQPAFNSRKNPSVLALKVRTKWQPRELIPDQMAITSRFDGRRPTPCKL